jgi:hypothetical protein
MIQTACDTFVRRDMLRSAKATFGPDAMLAIFFEVCASIGQ